MQGMLNPGEPQMQGMAQAGRDLGRSFSPSSYLKQDQHQMQVKLLRAWAEGGQSTDSLVAYFHAKPLSWWWFFFFFLMSLWLLFRILSLCSYRRSLAPFPYSPLRQWKTTNTSLLSHPPVWTSPVLSASLHAACASAPDHADGLWLSSPWDVSKPCCILLVPSAMSVDIYFGPGNTHTGLVIFDNLWYVWALSNVGQIQKHASFFSRSPNKSTSI